MTEPLDVSNRSQQHNDLQPHRRRNALTDEWVLVSPHRNKRPWQGQTETQTARSRITHDPNCYLCPGNERMGGQRNPDFEATFVFANDFPAITPLQDATDTDTSKQRKDRDPLFESRREHGECRVVSYSPDHSKTLAEMHPAQLKLVVDEWARQSDDLGKRYPWVQVFENKGEIMGCSMPHPHGQIWAQTNAPTLLSKEEQAQQAYFVEHNKALLLDYAKREQTQGTRIVVDAEHWIAVVPYWAAWPFETMLLPTFPVQRLSALNTEQRATLAEVLSQLLIRYDNMFECSFPYSMGWHGAPYTQDESSVEKQSHWQLHAHFYPPLLRSSTVRKFMVGYEMLAEPQRDLTPEQAAEVLRSQSATHFHSV